MRFVYFFYLCLITQILAFGINEKYFVYDDSASEKGVHLHPICAIVYEHDFDNGASMNIYANQSLSELPPEFDEVISAVYIFNGCQFMGYHEKNFEGLEFKNFILGYQVIYHDGHGDVISSIKCSCKQSKDVDYVLNKFSDVEDSARCSYILICIVITVVVVVVVTIASILNWIAFVNKNKINSWFARTFSFKSIRSFRTQVKDDSLLLD